MALKLFVDFDGTITREDVGNAFFRRFAGHGRYDDILNQYKAGLISAQECFRRGIAAIGTLSREEAAAFVRNHQIDPSFRPFLGFCRSNSLSVHVVSDGLEFYIREIFAANGIDGVPIFANTLEFLSGSPSDKMYIEFPYSDAECQRCACCKRNIMLTHAGDEDVIVYVGEGYSDQCPVQYSDIVFAKDALQTYCQQQNISYYLYRSFDDVCERLSGLLQRRRKRLAAEKKRRALFMREP
jgi:2,3-diketo-5-methylthio-1-phosphopentane phosphatase